MDYSGIDGFLGTRASLMLDVVFSAMFLVLPALSWSVYLVKYRRKFALHKRIQLTLGLVLLVAVLLFEVDMRVNGWRGRAAGSPYSRIVGISCVAVSLAIHLCFAVTTTVLWIAVIAQALRRFPRPPQPNEHSRWHIFWA